jgi:nucleotide-binding universal stress UspA family protein/GNAT superfamily N-acetyltransferase
VARSESVARVLVATDGSVAAGRAIDHLATTSYLGQLPLEVIAVAPTIASATPISELDVTEASLHVYADEVAEARKHAEVVAASAAERLSTGGRTVRWTISVGDAAREIIEAAQNLGCDLVVVGSRGLTGLRRVLLGSVARNVLLHTGASVLVVRDATHRASDRAGSGIRVGSDEADDVMVRPIQPSDDDALQRFYSSLSEESRRRRFLGWNAGLRPGQSRTFCTTDHEHREGFVAVMTGRDGPTIVGHLCLEPDGEGSAELAVAVADEMQRKGIGRALVRSAVEWARRNGTSRLTASAACSNSAIFLLLRSAGLKVRTSSGGAGICDIVVELEPAPAVAV